MDTLENFPLASVVMINWNRKEILKQALTSLIRQTYRKYEIIIVDNGSCDGAPEMVEKEFPQVKLIRLSKNIGIDGYNVGFRRSSGEFIVILDNDSFLEDEGINKIVRKFQTYPRLGALGCKVYNYYSGRVHHWHPVVREENGPDEGFDSPLFNGCAAAARRNVLDEVGFYPPEFFLYENERDLCTRIINAGYEVKYFTDIAGFHINPKETHRSERLVFYANRNLIWYFWKYLPIGVALERTIAVSVYNIIRGIRTLKLGMHLKPILAGLFGLPKILKHRCPIKKEYVSKVIY